MSPRPSTCLSSNQDDDSAPVVASGLICPVQVEGFIEISSALSLEVDNNKEDKLKRAPSCSSFFDSGALDPVDLDKDNAESEDSPRPVSKYIFGGIIAFSVLYTIFFSGAIFGWGPMQLLLENDGAFESQCNEDEELPCDKQSVRLVQIQLVATLTAVFAPFLGMYTDCYGALALMYLISFCGVTSIILTMLASSAGLHELYYISFSLAGLTFVATTQMIVQTGIVMPEAKMQQRVISTLNALIDAGSIVYLGLFEVSKASGAGLVQIMGGYLGFALFCFAGAIIFWTMLVQSKEPSTTTAESPSCDGPVETEAGIKCATKPIDGEEDLTIDDVHEGEDKNIAKIGTLEKGKYDSNNENEQASQYIMIAHRSPWKQLTSKQYILLLIFFSIHNTRNNWVMATSRDFLASLGDDDHGNKYTQLFTGLSSASLIGLPLLDLLMNKYGYHATLQAVNILGVAHGILQVSTDNLNVQVLGFIVFSFYRCFTFSATFSFVSTFLSGNNVGRGCGGLSFVAAIVSLVNMGLSKWAIDGLDGDFFIPNLLMLLVLLPIFNVTWMIGKCVQNEKGADAFGSAKNLDTGNLSHHTTVSLPRTCRIANVGSMDEVVDC